MQHLYTRERWFCLTNIYVYFKLASTPSLITQCYHSYVKTPILCEWLCKVYLLRVGRGGVSFFTMDNNIIMFIIKNNETHGASILLIISSLDSKDSVTVKLANGLHVRNTFLQIWSVKKKRIPMHSINSWSYCPGFPISKTKDTLPPSFK